MTVACLLCSFLLLQGGGPPPQPGPTTGTAIVRGIVTDKDTGQPMPRAVVTLRLTSPGRTLESRTSADGTFAFTKLPRGLVYISASVGEHRMTHVPETFPPMRPDGSSVPTMLAEGQVRDVTIALARAFAISGRVLDDAGEPLAGLSVALRAGQNRSMGLQRPWVTDDRGYFRLFGVAPGRYSVCARALTSPIFDGRFAQNTRRVVRPTCYPSAVDDDPGTLVTVVDGDIEGIEIRVARVATLSLSGSVLTASGEPAGGVNVTLNRREGTSSGGVGTTIGPDGRFTIANVVPGTYSLTADSSPPPPAPATRGDIEYGQVDLGAISADVDGIVIAMKLPVRVRGRVVFEATPPPGLPSMSVVPRAGSAGRFRGAPEARVGPELTFEITDVFGPLRLHLFGLPRGWIVRSVRYRGRDITGTLAEFRNGPDEVEITVSDRGAVLAGTAVDDLGNPASGARVFLFPADSDRREQLAMSLVSVSKDGRFTLPPHRPDEYLVVAVAAADAARFTNDKGYELLAPYAERVTLLENDRRAIDLRLVKIPEERKTP